MQGPVCVFVLLLSVCPALLSPVPEPIRCVPCSADQLASCPPVSPGCAEVLREPGCGCCWSCALQQGASCGVYTAPCGAGLRCTPRAGETRPLHALTRGTAVCVQAQPAQEDADDAAEQDALHQLLGLNGPLETQDEENIRARVNAIRKKLTQQGPCHSELRASLDVIAESQQALGEKFTSFYLPNCDKHGFYKAKQCETSLSGAPARCWCVSSWNGKRTGGGEDLPAESQCQQELTH